jgi:S1-C subfamily serine protease
VDVGVPARPVNEGNLGMQTEAVVQADGSRGMKITGLLPETVVANAGLHTGDIILSVNGYHTEQSGNLVWIMANAMSDNTLTMNVRKAKDGREHSVTVRLPLLEPLSTSRPAYLPMVGNGPPPATR